MVVVHSVSFRLKSIVVVQSAVGPVQTSHLIYFITQVGQHCARHSLTHVGLGIQRVARQMYHELTFQDTHRISINNPFDC